MEIPGHFSAEIDTGTKATNDSPAMQRLARSYAALPFTDNDTPAITNEKAN
jgi:hypothetical protein